jgi:hypothetical protein
MLFIEIYAVVVSYTELMYDYEHTFTQLCGFSRISSFKRLVQVLNSP